MKSKIAALIMVLTLLASHSAFAKVYKEGSADKRQVAITVDDCWDLAILEQMLDLFKQEQIHVTIYPVGMKIFPEDQALWRRVPDEGHEFGNHTFSHLKLTKRDASTVISQLRRMERALNKALGYEYKIRTLRPPYGAFSENNTLKTIRRGGYNKVIMWSVSQREPEMALKKAKNGSIFLFHTNKKDLECLAALIPMLRDAGYEMVTISELLGFSDEETI